MGIFIQGSLGFANMVLALFVIFFAVSFLARTRNSRDRKPWIFLFTAVVIFFIMQIFKVLDIMGHINLGSYSFYLDSMFIAVVLFTFIFQYNLILSSELIQIKRKSDSDNVNNLTSELDVVERIEKKLQTEEEDIVNEEKELGRFTKKAKNSVKKIKKGAKQKSASIKRKR